MILNNTVFTSILLFHNDNHSWAHLPSFCTGMLQIRQYTERFALFCFLSNEFHQAFPCVSPLYVIIAKLCCTRTLIYACGLEMVKSHPYKLSCAWVQCHIYGNKQDNYQTT